MTKTEQAEPDLKAELRKVVKAWEKLPGGLHGPYTIQSWLEQDMAPAINRARRVLGLKKPNGEEA